jgi:hypothetical protein
MRISKLCPAVCAAMFFAGFLAVHADDTPAQAAARAALEAKMKQLDAQPPTTPVIIFTPGASMNSATAPQAEAPAGSKAMTGTEAALWEKMAELDAQATQPQAAAPAPAPASPEALARAKAALERKIAELNQQPVKMRAVAPKAAKPASVVQTPVSVKSAPLPAAPAPVAATPAPEANANYPGKDLGLKPIPAPPLPISAEQEAQLRALNAKYLANEITPEEYHVQRAKILGEP